jgi:hypothetical protein
MLPSAGVKPGDVIVSSNWIIHGSYRSPEMKKGRTSAEVRYGERRKVLLNCYFFPAFPARRGPRWLRKGSHFPSQLQAS